MSRAVQESNRRMLRARDAMDRAYAQPLDVAALARIAQVSPTHFTRTFRATFGETPHRYLQRRRVERAMALLRDTGRSVTDICFEIGFGFMRWLTVDVPGHPDRQILLQTPGGPAMSAGTAEQVRELLTKGASGGQLILSTDDCRKTYETLRGLSVEFTEEPTERPYGIDCGMRHPFGNHIRFTQPTS